MAPNAPVTRWIAAVPPNQLIDDNDALRLLWVSIKVVTSGAYLAVSLATFVLTVAMHAVLQRLLFEVDLDPYYYVSLKLVSRVGLSISSHVCLLRVVRSWYDDDLL